MVHWPEKAEMSARALQSIFGRGDVDDLHCPFQKIHERRALQTSLGSNLRSNVVICYKIHRWIGRTDSVEQFFSVSLFSTGYFSAY